MTAQEFQALLIEGGIDQETVNKLTGNNAITNKLGQLKQATEYQAIQQRADALLAEKQQLEAVVTELTARWKETQDRCGAALAAVAWLKTAAVCPTLREAEIRAWVQAERVGAQPGPFMHPLTDDLDLVLEALDASRAIASEWKARFEETQHTGRCVCTDTNSDHDSTGVCTRCSCRHFEEQK